MRFLSAILLFALSIPASAAGLGTSGGSFLRITPTARPLAMGNAYTGVAEDIYSLPFNPAGLSTIRSASIALSHIDVALGVRYEYLAAARRFSSGIVGAVNLTYLYADDVRRDAAGNRTGTFQNSDMAVGLSLARNISESFSLGGTMRYIRSDLAEYDATAFGADLGIRYRPPSFERITLGAAVQNIGNDIKFISDGDPQPLSVRLGGSWLGWRERLLIAADVAVDREERTELALGGELKLIDRIYLRSGIDVAEDNDFERGFKVGLGFISTAGNFDYAFESIGEVGNNHRFSYAYSFASGDEGEAGESRFFVEEEEDEEISAGRTPVYIGRFRNISGDRDLDWLERGLSEIMSGFLGEEDEIFLADDAAGTRFRVDGRFADLRPGTLWIGVRLFNTDANELVAYREISVSEENIFRGMEALSREISSEIPR